MSRRSSSTVRHARANAHHPLDRNGLPVLDGDKQRNTLPKRCQGPHRFVRLERRFLFHDSMTGDTVYAIESRCVNCGDKLMEQVRE